MKIEQIARVAHEINKAYCESIGDFSQKPWDEASHWQQVSAKAGVVFHQDNPDATPEDSHNNWYSQKLREGWSYDLVKDEEKKHHPCLIAYYKLPQEQRTKDYLFKAIVTALSTCD